MIDFRPLASSSAGCAYIVRSGSHAPLLIDAGVRFALIQEALDFKVTSLAGCLISHSHGDHCKAVPSLVKAGVNCYASAETWAALGNQYHRAIKMDEQYLMPVGGWSVLPFKAVHDVPGTLGFVIESPCRNSRLLYLTDSAYSPYRFDGLTHIAIECNFSREIIRNNVERKGIDFERYKRTTQTHMSLERLIDMLKANDLSKVEEIHLLHLSDANSDEEAFKKAVQQATGKPVYVAAKEEVRV